MSNPVFNRIDQESRRGYAGFGGNSANSYGGVQDRVGPAPMRVDQLDDMYNMPAAGPRQTGRLTLDDVYMKSAMLFGLMLVTAGAVWAASMTMGLGVAQLASLVGAVTSLVLGLVIAFKKTISPALIMAFAVFEGLMVGGISTVFAALYEGLVTTAIVATLSVFVAMFLGWKTGIVKVTARSRRMVSMAIFGYLIFALVNFGFSLAGMNSGWGIFGAGSNAGILVSLFVVGLASYTLAMDFDSIQSAVAAGAPEKYSWLLAHGLLVTVVWLYMEILRLLAHFQNR